MWCLLVFIELRKKMMNSTVTDPAVRIRIALTDIERDLTYQIRHDVFCREQKIFSHTDRDAIDAIALPLVALRVADNVGEDQAIEAVGTVRIHEAARGLWIGSRLAVRNTARRSAAIGSGLIRLAVGIARAHGCSRFLAHVQSQNVALFERLHWHSQAEETVHGRSHHLMQADLDWYPPVSNGDIGFILPMGLPLRST